MFLLAKYGTQTDFRFPIVKRGVVDLAASSDWTPATGDTKISKDGGNFANTTNNPAAVGGTGSIGWAITITATELQCAEANIQIVDSATKAVEDQYLVIYTYGNASAKIPIDLSDTVRLGLTALPNAAAAGNGGLPTADASNAVKVQSGTGANQIALSSGQVTVGTNNDKTGYTAATVGAGAISSGSFAAGAIDAAAIAANAIGAAELAADVVTDIWMGTVLTEGYAADGAEATPAQLLYMIYAALMEFAISGSTMTVKKLDGSTTAMTVDLDDASNPTSRTRSA